MEDKDGKSPWEPNRVDIKPCENRQIPGGNGKNEYRVVLRSGSALNDSSSQEQVVRLVPRGPPEWERDLVGRSVLQQDKPARGEDLEPATVNGRQF
jgi:hypothetical protein